MVDNWIADVEIKCFYMLSICMLFEFMTDFIVLCFEKRHALICVIRHIRLSKYSTIIMIVMTLIIFS